MKIGLISDTHGWLDPAVLHHFKACNEIWHAGDIGSMEVLRTLQTLKPVRAVYGNIDDPNLMPRFSESLQFELEGFKILITHIGGTPPHYNAQVKKDLRSYKPNIFICGHSHILKIMRDATHNNLLYINPGAAGNHGFHAIRTVVRFELESKEIKNMEVIELGKRGAL